MCKSEYSNMLQESLRETLGIIGVMEDQGQGWTGQPSSPHGPRPGACAVGDSPSGSHAAWLSALGPPPAVPPAGPSRTPGPQKVSAPPGGKARRILGEIKSLCSEPSSSRFLPLGQLHTLPLSLPPTATLSKVSPGTPRKSFPRPYLSRPNSSVQLLGGVSLPTSLFYPWPHQSLQDPPFHSLLLTFFTSLTSAHPKELVPDSTCCILTRFTQLLRSPKQG